MWAVTATNSGWAILTPTLLYLLTYSFVGLVRFKSCCFQVAAIKVEVPTDPVLLSAASPGGFGHLFLDQDLI